MNDGGNHGGAGEGETSPALVFISPKFRTISSGLSSPLEAPLSGTFQYYDTVEQSDIAPTLAALVGFPVPINNLGVLIRRTLDFWPNDQQIRLMHQNALQILRIAQSTFPHMSLVAEHKDIICQHVASHAAKLSCLWSKATLSIETLSHSARLNAYQEFCREAQTILSSTASNYNIPKMSLGICLTLLGVALSIQVMLAVLTTFTTGALFSSCAIITWGFMMFASSYVEEEHHFWYWAGSAWMLICYAKCQRRLLLRDHLTPCLLLIPLLLLRVTRSWNQTGQKHVGSPDIAKHILPAHPGLLWILVILTYCTPVVRLATCEMSSTSRWMVALPSIILGLVCLMFKITFTFADSPELLAGFDQLLPSVIRSMSLVLQAKVIYAIATALVLNFVARAFLGMCDSEARSRNSHPATGKVVATSSSHDTGNVCGIHDVLTMFLITQSRTVNIPLYLLFELQAWSLRLMKLSVMDIVVTSSLLQYAAFFSFGGSNAISSIDLSNAYNGISGYNVGAVGFLTFVGNWAGSIWWSSANHTILSRQSGCQTGSFLSQYIAFIIAWGAASTFAVMVACSALRSHLFIWTVFSPKYLYALAWYFGQHVCINIGYGSFIHGLSHSRGS